MKAVTAGSLASYIPVGPGNASMAESPAGVNPSEPRTASPNFFPAAVWYGGGKARAPMLDPVTASSARLWR